MKRIQGKLNSRAFVIVLSLVFIVLLIISGVYAWFTWSSSGTVSGDANLNMSIGENTAVTFAGGNEINAAMTPVYSYIDGEKTTFTLTNKATAKEVRMNVYLNIDGMDNELKNSSFKYVLLDGSNNVINTGDFTSHKVGETVLITELYEVPYGSSNYTFIVFIDGNMENSTNMTNKSFSGSVYVEVSSENITASEYIRLLFNQNTKNITDYINGNVTYMVAPSVNLIKDRYGSSNNAQDTGNTRYFGNNPNNYINFNCTNYETQTGCELWRIIGEFDGHLKIVRNDSLESGSPLSWDFDYNDDTSMITYSNVWSNSSLKNLLNGLYYNRGKSENTTYYSGNYNDSQVYELNINLTGDGINDTTRSMIFMRNWGDGNTLDDVYADQVYTNLEASDISQSVGLISLADYAYSVSFDSCNQKLKNYDRCTSWMTDKSENFWTMTSVMNETSVYYINESIGTADAIMGTLYTARPVVYLISDISIVDGLGTITDPYKINVN